MLEIKNADVGYGKKIVLGGITEGFDHGRLVSIVGTNGAGKSTLLLALAGFIPCQSGDVLIDGTPISKFSEREVALRIAFLAQERRVPDMTVGELVLHGRFAKRRIFGSYGSDDRAAAEAAIEENERLREENLALSARVKALRAQRGELSGDEDYSDRESFLELEREYDAFTRFYKKQWGKTKKRIRKELLDPKNLKDRRDDE